MHRFIWSVILVFFGTLCLCWTLTVSGQEQEEEDTTPTYPSIASPYWDKIKNERSLVFSVSRSYAPFAMKTKDGRLIGFDVDLARHMARTLGLEKITFVRPTFPQQIPYLLDGRTDIILAGMTRTASRGIDVNFSAPYFTFTQAVLLDERSLPAWTESTEINPPRPQSFFDLDMVPGLTVGVGQGTNSQRLVERFFPNAKVTAYPSAMKAADALLAGKVKAVVGDSPFVNVWHSVKAPRRISKLTEPATRESMGIAIRKGDLEFLAWLNLFIDEVKADGTYDRLYRKYFIDMDWKGKVAYGE